MTDLIRVGDRSIGFGQPCFLVAEVGVNHNGDVSLAHRLIDAAADAGADAVKFQNYRTEDFISDRSLTYEYISQGRNIVEKQYDMFKRCELSNEALRELFEHCDRRELIVFCTPTSEDGVRNLVDLGVPLLKNGSDYLTNLPLIRAMASTGLPTVMSTGMATLSEIEEAVGTFHEAGGKNLILFVCTSLYPTPPEETHLRRIPELRKKMNCPVGLSDHTQGNVAALGAIALGACMIEKHFTLDRNLSGPDHWFSAIPNEFRALVHDARTLEKALGQSKIAPTPSEKAPRDRFRLSCVAARDLTADQMLRESDVVFRRPGTGLPPKALKSLIGRRLARSIGAGALLNPEDFV